MKQKTHAIATALVKFKQKASLRLKTESLRLKAVGQFSKKPLTNRLLLRPGAHPTAPLITMTGKGEAGLRFNNDTPTAQSHATGSGGPVKRRAGSLALRDEGSFYLDFLNTFSSKEKVLSLRGGEREDSQHKDNNPIQPAITTPFNSPASGVHWAETYRVGNILKKGICQLKQLLLTNRLPQPNSHNTDTSLITIMRKRRGTAVKLRPNILMVLLVAVVVIIGKQTEAQDRALQIGDSIPEAVWNSLLNLVNHPTGESSVMLKEYKGRLIILDFWATSCGTCIGKMPELAEINRNFNQQALVLPVSYQPAEKVQAFMRINPVMKKLQMTSVVADTLFQKLFPHRYLPHEVWINAQGNVMALTESEYVNAANIKEALQGNLNTDGTTKTDLLSFKKGQVLFPHQQLYYREIGAFIPGLRYTAGTVTDSVRQFRRYYVINAPVLQLYALALANGGLALNPKSRILEVQHPENYVYTRAQGYRQNWLQKNSYSFETVMPLHSTTAERKQELLKTLNRYFNTDGHIEKRRVNCWIIRNLPAKSGVKKRGGANAGIKLADFVHLLNQDSRLPCVIDETGRPQKELSLSLRAEADWDFARLAQILAAQGLDLKQEQRFLDRFVLTENSFNPSPKP